MRIRSLSAALSSFALMACAPSLTPQRTAGDAPTVSEPRELTADQQVAHVLSIAPKTASTHIERIYMKCDVSSRSDATRFAIAHGLVKPLMPTGF